MNLLDRIRVVLVGTTHPGNIGAAARAMKTMGIYQLALVAPRSFPHAEAYAMASGADDLLETAKVYHELSDAIADCHWVMGSSARLRTLPLRLKTPREAAQILRQQVPGGDIALVFGREHSGLTNEELLQCHLHIHIPSDERFPTLNVAASVQLIAYEMRLAALEEALLNGETGSSSDAPESAGRFALAPHQEYERFFEHLQSTLTAVDFIRSKTNLESIMRRLRRLFLRTELEQEEVHMLRGILTAVQKLTASPKSNAE